MKKLYFFFETGSPHFHYEITEIQHSERERKERGVRTSLTRQPSEPHNLIQVMGSVNITNDA